MTVYTKISELPVAGTLTDDDVFILNDASITSKLTFASLKTSISSFITSQNLTFSGTVELQGVPTAPTAGVGTNTTQIATTEFVTAAMNADNSAETLDQVSLRGGTTNVDISVGDLFTVQGDGASQDGRIKLNCSQNSHGVSIQAPPHSANATYTLVLPETDGTAGDLLTSDGSGVLSWTAATSILNSSVLTGTPTADTAAAGTNTTQLATTEFVTAAITADNSTDALLASPALTGTPTAPTAGAGTNTTQIATTEFVLAEIASDNSTDALLASPALTGTPTAPTAAAGTNTTQLATTEFVTAAITADNSTDLILGTSSIDALGDVDTTTAAPSSGDFLKFDGSNFVPGLPDAPTTFELDGTTLRNVTGGHLIGLRNAASATTISLNSETGGADFADRVYSTEYRAVGSGHLKLRAETGNDLNIYLADTETLQITRDPSTGNPKFTAVGGTGKFIFNQEIDLLGVANLEGGAVVHGAGAINFRDGAASSGVDAAIFVDQTSHDLVFYGAQSSTTIDFRPSAESAPVGSFSADGLEMAAGKKVEAAEFHSVGTGHLKFRGGGNDIIFYPQDTETLQITRSGTDCRFTSNGGTGTFKFNQDVTQRPGSSVTPSANGDLSVEATNDTTLTFKFKGSDGVVRSGTITLS